MYRYTTALEHMFLVVVLHECSVCSLQDDLSSSSPPSTPHSVDTDVSKPAPPISDVDVKPSETLTPVKSPPPKSHFLSPTVLQSVHSNTPPIIQHLPPHCPPPSLIPSTTSSQIVKNHDHIAPITHNSPLPHPISQVPPPLVPASVAASLNKTSALDQLQKTTEQFPRRPITSLLSQEQSTISDKNLPISKSSSRLPEIPPLASLQSLSGGHQLQSVPLLSTNEQSIQQKFQRPSERSGSPFQQKASPRPYSPNFYKNYSRYPEQSLPALQKPVGQRNSDRPYSPNQQKVVPTKYSDRPYSPYQDKSTSSVSPSVPKTSSDQLPPPLRPSSSTESSVTEQSTLFASDSSVQRSSRPLSLPLVPQHHSTSSSSFSVDLSQNIKQEPHSPPVSPKQEVKKDSGYSLPNSVLIDSAKDTVIKTEPLLDLSKLTPSSMDTPSILSLHNKTCDSQVTIKTESTPVDVQGEPSIVKIEKSESVIEVMEEETDSDREGSITPGPEPTKCSVDVHKSKAAM